MTEDTPEWEAFVAIYRAKDELEAAIKKSMDVLWNGPEEEEWDTAYRAAEAVYEDADLWNNLQTVIDALEALSDED